jgi:hypothetical protein
MEPPKRNQVLVVGAEELATVEFKQRYLELKFVTEEEAPKYFNVATAVVVAAPARKFALIKNCLSGLFLQAEDHQLAQAIVVHSLEDLVQVDAMRKKEFPTSQAKIVLGYELWRAAELAARHDPGPPASEVKIEPDSISLSVDDRLLLRRAFFDCERIFLEKITGGRASMAVFRVHAWLRPEYCIAGPRPLPFFVKLADPSSIEQEKEKYRQFAERFIPFNLRPNIDQSRCVRTRNMAVLAGDFVDDAVPLRKCLKLGMAVGALFALFETSLKGFRLQPFASGKSPLPGGLTGFARDRIKLSEMPEEILSRARGFGLSLSPGQLWDSLQQASEKIASIMGPCHGDLHAGNVMVRGGDAIVIDFYSVENGPLTADPAALEVSLMFGKDEDDNGIAPEDWRAFVAQIYPPEPHSLHPPALSESQPGPFSWLRRSVRELRHILLACNMHEHEAKIILATYLIRFARLGKNALDEGDDVAFDRHAYALVVAERIAATLAPTKGVT